MKVLLHHFSEKPWVFNPGFTYSQTPSQRRNIYKPNGLWVSDESQGDGWKSWCEAAEFGLERLTHKTALECDISTWKVLNTPESIAEFNKQYRYKALDILESINWKQVALEYAGILITPYQHSTRWDLGAMWYYGWDCASGCVWDLTTVNVITSGQEPSVGSDVDKIKEAVKIAKDYINLGTGTFLDFRKISEALIELSENPQCSECREEIYCDPCTDKAINEAIAGHFTIEPITL